jgi:hypothetical protein
MKMDINDSRELQMESSINTLINELSNKIIYSMVQNKTKTSPMHEWIIFSNRLELIKTMVREELEEMEYFK